MKRTAALLAAVATAGALSATTLTAAPAAAASCSVTWGSLPKVTSDPKVSTGVLTNLRAGRHACFDRLVVDLDGKVQDYDVHYGAVYEPGEGTRIPLRGTDMHVEVYAPAYDDGGATYDPARDSEAVDVSGFSTFRQVAWGHSFEAQSTIGLGVRARLPFRVLIADGPGTGSRLVIDVAHAW